MVSSSFVVRFCVSVALPSLAFCRRPSHLAMPSSHPLTELLMSADAGVSSSFQSSAPRCLAALPAKASYLVCADVTAMFDFSAELLGEGRLGVAR